MSQPINRRELLKILAATAGVTVLSSVPNKWKTPVVEIGVLPAHAQNGSGLGTITGTITPPINAPAKNSKLSGPNLACTYGLMVTATRQPGNTPLPSVCVGLNSQENYIYTISNVPFGTYCLTVSADDGACPSSPTCNVVVNSTVPVVVNLSYSGCPA